MFYYCVPDKDRTKTFLYYDAKFTPGKIILDYTSYNLYSYLVEIWVYYLGGFSKPKNYYFYSNFGKLYTQPDGNFFFANEVKINNLDDNLIVRQWNKLLFEVLYTKIQK